MQERDIFDEKQETKKQFYNCTFCGQRGEYSVRWLKRTKKKNFRKNMNEQERMQFEKSRDYLIRVDDVLMCQNNLCRRRFEIPSAQTVVFI